MTISIIIWAVLIILQVADAVTTWKIIKAGGKEEGAISWFPVMAWLISKVGLRAALIESKAIIIAATGVVLLVWPEPIVQIVMAVLAAYYGWVGWHNIKEL